MNTDGAVSEEMLVSSSQTSLKSGAPKNSSSFLGTMLEKYFSLVNQPDSLQHLLRSERPVVIVTLSNSIIIHSLLTSLFKKAGEQIVPLSYTSDPLPRFSWVSLHNLQPLSQALKVHPELKVSTLNLFHFRGPARTNPSYRMGFRQLTRVLWDARSMWVIFGEPFRPAENTISSPARIARQLKLDFYKNLKLVRGTPFQDLDVQERTILSGHEFERELKIIAQREGLSIEAARKRAKKEFYGFAANPYRPMYGLMAPIARLIINRLFSDVRLEGLDRLKESVQNSTVVLVPMHRSHLDYVVLGSTLYDACLNPPLVAAGVNLRFWPAGPIIRSLGAYFVKRQARQDRIHALLLKRYVSYLIKRGHMQEFFIEGGRSRSGRMRPPKLGLLGVIAEAAVKKNSRQHSTRPRVVHLRTGDRR